MAKNVAKQPTRKWAKVLISKDQNDTSPNKYFSYNLVGFTIKVNEPVEVPYEVYEECIMKSHYADRTVLLGTSER